MIGALLIASGVSVVGRCALLVACAIAVHRTTGALLAIAGGWI